MAEDRRLLLLAPEDNVYVACARLPAGTRLRLDDGEIDLGEELPPGFKLARRDIGAGERILKYGAPIGSATSDIRRGESVHLHNMRSDYLPTYTLDEGTRFIEGEET